MSPIEVPGDIPTWEGPANNVIEEKVKTIFFGSGHNNAKIKTLRSLYLTNPNEIIPAMESVLFRPGTAILDAPPEQQGPQVNLLKSLFQGDGTTLNSDLLKVAFQCLLPDELDNSTGPHIDPLQNNYQKRRSLAIANYTSQINLYLRQNRGKSILPITNFSKVTGFLVGVRNRESDEAWSKLINFADMTPLEFIRNISNSNPYPNSHNEMLALALLSCNAMAHSLQGYSTTIPRWRPLVLGPNKAFEIWLNLDESYDSSPTNLLSKIIDSILRRQQ